MHYQTPLSDGERSLHGGEGRHVHEFPHVADADLEHAQVRVGGRAARHALDGGERLESRAARRRRASSRCFTARCANGFVYMPGAGGRCWKSIATPARSDAASASSTLARSAIYVTSPITVDDDGNLYYNMLKLAGVAARGRSITRRVAGEDRARRHGIARVLQTLVPERAGGDAQCTGEFSVERSFPGRRRRTRSRPRSPAARSAQGSTSRRRSAPDGTIYTVSRTHLNSRWGWIVAVNPDLTPKWATSLRNRFHDGCNVLLPPNGTAGRMPRRRDDRRRSLRQPARLGRGQRQLDLVAGRRAGRHDLLRRVHALQPLAGTHDAVLGRGRFLSAYRSAGTSRRRSGSTTERSR